MEPPVLLHIDTSNIAWITLNRPERLNAFDETLIAALRAALASVAEDNTLRAAVLRGAGRAFCAGADVAWMRRMAGYGSDENLADAQNLASLLQNLDRLRVPTLALVQGAAYGGGVGLVACCDIVLAGASAKFCLSETRLGLSPATISPYVIAAMGARQARRYFVSAETIDPARAVAIGLAHEAVADENMLTRAEEILHAILAGKPHAQAEAKRLVAEALYRPVDDALMAQTSRRIAERRAHPEARAALAAFLDRR